MLLCAFLLTGCASRMSKDLPRMSTLAEAMAAFGAPLSSKELPDGTFLYEWGFDQTVFVPGQYVTQMIYLGHDRDGYRKYHEREVWVPAHRQGRFCHIAMVANATGLVLHSSYQGNKCDEMFRSDSVR